MSSEDTNYKTLLVTEASELDSKITKLEAFIPSTTYTALPYPDRHLLQHQLRTMQSYSRILQQRIERAIE